MNVDKILCNELELNGRNPLDYFGYHFNGLNCNICIVLLNLDAEVAVSSHICIGYKACCTLKNIK